MALFESYERRIDKINGVLAEYGIGSIEECRTICNDLGFDPYEIVKGIQPICFENACWAYTMGAAIAVKKGNTELLDQLNAFIAQSKTDGEFDRLTEKYLADEKKAFDQYGFKWFFDFE